MNTVNTPCRQRGATLIGMLCIIAVLGLGLYAVVRLMPKYLEYYSIVKTLDRVAQEAAGGATVEKIRTALNRHWQVEDITSIKYDEVVIRKVGSGYEMTAEYRAEMPFIANVSLVADFEKSVTVQ